MKRAYVATIVFAVLASSGCYTAESTEPAKPEASAATMAASSRAHAAAAPKPLAALSAPKKAGTAPPAKPETKAEAAVIPHSIDPSQAVYELKEGDTLGGVAKKIYGRASDWRWLATLNGIDDPAKVMVGELIVYTRTGAKAPYASASAKSYSELQIRKGVRIGEVAEQSLGKRALWPYLKLANESRVPDALTLPAGAILLFSAERAKAFGHLAPAKHVAAVHRALSKLVKASVAPSPPEPKKESVLKAKVIRKQELR